jgi:hypothetical protein
VLDQHKGKYEKVFQNNTRFGAGAEWHKPQDDEVMDDSAWGTLPMLRNLKNKATKQLGTSSCGNQFAELGELTVVEDDPQLGGARQVFGVADAQLQPRRGLCYRQSLQQDCEEHAPRAGAAR